GAGRSQSVGQSRAAALSEDLSAAPASRSAARAGSCEAAARSDATRASRSEVDDAASEGSGGQGAGGAGDSCPAAVTAGSTANRATPSRTRSRRPRGTKTLSSTPVKPLSRRGLTRTRKRNRREIIRGSPGNAASKRPPDSSKQRGRTYETHRHSLRAGALVSAGARRSHQPRRNRHGRRTRAGRGRGARDAEEVRPDPGSHQPGHPLLPRDPEEGRRGRDHRRQQPLL